MITLLDYGAGNVRSVINAIESLGARVRRVRRPADITAAEKLVFPGVGAFASMMRILQRDGFVEPLRQYLAADRPFLGICLGMQALFAGSEEAPGIAGLGVLPGAVRRFRTRLAVPHIGWNGIRARQASPLFAGLQGDEKFYFVHSYHVHTEDRTAILTLSDYGTPFVSAVQRGRIVGTQFHPEKSGPAGLRLLANFLAGDRIPCRPPRTPERTVPAKRIIACLDVRADDHGELVVTKGDQYDVREDGAVRDLGRPADLAQHYYRQGVDELTFLNITGFRAFPLQDMPMLEVLRQTSRKVFVPLTIGGGIRDFTDRNGRHWSALEVAGAYFRSGADKVSVGSDAVAAVEDFLRTGEATGQSAIEEIARVYGNQAVVISIDPRRIYVPAPDAVPRHVIATARPGPAGERWCWYQCTVKGGREGRPVDAVTLARVCEHLGAGEILLNCIDRDGTRDGFDLELIRAVKAAVTIPVIASSGAGCADHFVRVFTRTAAEAALAAGIFHRGLTTVAEVKEHLQGKVEIRPQAGRG